MEEKVSSGTVSLNTIDESEYKIELHEQSSCRTPSVTNTKRPLTDSSSLSSLKKPNLEKKTIDESEYKIELHEQSSCRTPSVTNTKRPLSDSSSLSSLKKKILKSLIS